MKVKDFENVLNGWTKVLVTYEPEGEEEALEGTDQFEIYADELIHDMANISIRKVGVENDKLLLIINKEDYLNANKIQFADEGC